jgi:type VI secretion system protein ImpK
MRARSPGESASPPAERVHRRGVLALALQEPLTATERLRANRQSATDAPAFRSHIKQLLSAAHEEARRAGYAGEDIKLAIYAVVAFLDESALNSHHPAFAEWPRQPLQEELFGGHMGGETFFQNLQTLLGGQDTDDLADVLEVYQLCLLLGFQGRYGGAGPNEVRAWTTAVADKLARIRGGPQTLSPGWALPGEEVIPIPRDPWVRPLGYTALAVFAVSAFLSFFFWVGQQSWVTALRGVAR